MDNFRKEMITLSLAISCWRAETDKQKASTSGSPKLSSIPWFGVPMDLRVAASMRCVTLEILLKLKFELNFLKWSFKNVWPTWLWMNVKKNFYLLSDEFMILAILWCLTPEPLEVGVPSAPWVYFRPPGGDLLPGLPTLRVLWCSLSWN